MMTSAAATLLRCPVCRGTLGIDDRAGRCAQGHEFEVREGVLDLVPAELRDATWTLWEDHLDAFQRRREARVDNPSSIVAKVSDRKDQQAAFVDFIDPAGDVWLDLGCGPGKFSRTVPSSVRYVGVDPIPLLPDVLEIEFARAVSERLPFEDATFTDVTVLHAIDHVRDVAASLEEIARVLRPGGRVHFLQNVIEKSRPLRYLAHELKDFLEDRRDPARNADTPHHMEEFSAASLVAAVEAAGFTVVSRRYWAPDLVAPRRLMLSAQRP